MKFLLINTNQIVQKLVEITAKKAGANLTSIRESNEMGDLEQYDYVIIDDDCLSLDAKTYLNALKPKRKCLIYNKQGKRIEGFDDYVQKPFLPTSILDIFTAQLGHENTQNGVEAETGKVSIIEDIGDESANLSLDNLDEGLSEIDSLLEDSALDEHISSEDTTPKVNTESNQEEQAPNEQDAQTAEEDIAQEEISENESEEISLENTNEDANTDEEVSLEELELNDAVLEEDSTAENDLDVELDLSNIEIGRASCRDRVSFAV